MNYIKPNAQIKKFVLEDVILTSGVSTNPLTKVDLKSFLNSEANVSWKDKIN